VLLRVLRCFWGVLDSRGFLIGDEHFDLIEGFFGTGGLSRSRFAMGRAGMRTGDINLLASTARWFRVREICDEHYTLTGQHYDIDRKE